MNSLTQDDIAADIRSTLNVQEYTKKTIDGVSIISINSFLTEDGSFTELLHLNDQGNLEIMPEFHLAQVNRSIMLPGTVKAWHLHFNQDEIWNVGARSHVFLGLWDVREKSSTKGNTMRIPLSKDRLVYIPRGVAHGAANHMTHAVEIFYFVNNHYNKEHPDEQRIAWDSKGHDFWNMKKE